MESQKGQGPKGQRNVEPRATVDAPAGDCQRRTAAGPPAAPKLLRKTFLVDHTQSNSAPSATPGSVWSVKIHDFGKQWVEASWGKIDSRFGQKGFKGRSKNKGQNEKRAQARAKGEIRRKCLSIQADYLVTLTYRENMEDRDRVLTDLERLRRMLARIGYRMPYVAVLECQKRGAIHPSGRPRISGYSPPASLLVQDRGQGTGAGQCEGATAWNLPGQTGPVSLQVHQ